MKLILASASLRRAEILAAAGIPFETRATKVDEARRPGESPGIMVERLATAKAEAVAANLDASENAIVLGADTVVVADAQVLGKPLSKTVAREMLLTLRGREHQVITGFAALRAPGGALIRGHEVTRVWIGPMADTEVNAYVETGEPLDKAGAYAIQGIAGRYVSRIEGCYFNVVGLPLARIWPVLTSLGWHSS